MVEIICPNCGKKDEKHAKGLCYKCYRKIGWVQKKGICTRCGRERVIHTQGLCSPCANSVLYLDLIKKHNVRRYHGLDQETYHKVTQSCVVCGFSKIVELHHLNHDKTDNSKTNLIGICPNHHKMIHSMRYQKEVFEELKKKGFIVPEFNKGNDFFYKAQSS